MRGAGRAPCLSEATYDATYTIIASCIITIIIEGDTEHPFVAFAAPDGSAYFWNNNSGFGVMFGGKVERTTRALPIQ